MRKVDMRWPEGLFERVQAVAGRRGVTDYTVAALELALKDEQHPSQKIAPTKAQGASEEPRRAPTSPRRTEPVTDSGAPPASQTFKCPRDCVPSYRPASDRVRCPVCRQKVVPA